MEREYPSPRTALLGNDHVANVYCGVKYIAWQLVFALLAVGAIPVAAVRPLVGAVSSVVSVDEEFIESLVTGIMVAYLVVVGVIVIYGLILHPMLLVYSLAGIGAVTVFLLADEATGNTLSGGVRTTYRTVSGGAGKAVENAPERIVGYCPVSFSIEPKWFQALEDRLGP